MNWRLGFFRIWVVLSALWIAAVGTYGYSEWSVTKTYEVEDASRLKFTVKAPAQATQEEVVAFVQTAGETKKRQTECANKRGPWCEQSVTVEMPRKVNVHVILMTFLPPIVIF